MPCNFFDDQDYIHHHNNIPVLSTVHCVCDCDWIDNNNVNVVVTLPYKDNHDIFDGQLVSGISNGDNISSTADQFECSVNNTNDCNAIPIGGNNDNGLDEFDWIQIWLLSLIPQLWSQILSVTIIKFLILIILLIPAILFLAIMTILIIMAMWLL